LHDLNTPNLLLVRGADSLQMNIFALQQQQQQQPVVRLCDAGIGL